MKDLEFDSARIANYFKSKYSEEESSYISKIFCDKEVEGELKRFLEKEWYKSIQEDSGGDKNLDHILYRIHYEINMNSTRNKIKSLFNNQIRWFSGAAAILIISLATFFAFSIGRTAKNKNVAWIEIQAPAWTRAQFSLPDGTTGWLNSTSRLKYNVDFNKKRQVKLNGEAYFDVSKDPRKPFKVEVNEMDIIVSGTRFNVASYDNEDFVEIVLEEGKVACLNKAKDISYTLKPNDYLKFEKKTKELTIEPVMAEKYSSWKEGKLVFRNDPIDVIGRRLARWYNVEIEVRGEKADQTGLWATFKDENLEEVLKLLKLSLHLQYEIEYSQLQTNGVFSKTKVIITN